MVAQEEIIKNPKLQILIRKFQTDKTRMTIIFRKISKSS